MKQKLVLAVMLLFASSGFCSCNYGANQKAKQPVSKNQSIKPDSAVYATLGKTMSNILFNAKTVKVYTLKGVDKPLKTEYEVEPHWVRDSMISVLNPELCGVLKYMLIADINNYQKDSVKVRSPYYPQLEFAFTLKKETVSVIISLSNYSWTIMYDDKRQGNWNYADKNFMQRFCDMFLLPLLEENNNEERSAK